MVPTTDGKANISASVATKAADPKVIAGNWPGSSLPSLPKVATPLATAF